MKKVKKDIMDFTKAGVGLGVGTLVVSRVQQGAGISITPAFSAMGRMMPIVGTTMMGGHALSLVKNLQPKKKRKKRR